MVRLENLKLRKLTILFLTFSRTIKNVLASTNAAGQETLVGIVGRDFVLLGADTISSSGGGGIAMAASNVDKIHLLRDFVPSDGTCLAVAAAGKSADVDRIVGMLRAHAVIREYEAGVGSDVEIIFSREKVIESPSGLTPRSMSHFARSEIASSLRTRTSYNVCLLIAGIERCNAVSRPHQESTLPQQIQNQVEAATKYLQPRVMPKTNPSPEPDRPSRYAPRLFWLDGTGSLHNVRYGSHGYGSNFLLSILDKGYKDNMSKEEALELMNNCFAQLRNRYVINSGPYPPCIKCIDAINGCKILSGTTR